MAFVGSLTNNDENDNDTADSFSFHGYKVAIYKTHSFHIFTFKCF